MSKPLTVPDSILNSFLSATLASGATLVHPQYFYPTEFNSLGINKRDPQRNNFWGTIVTRPSKDEVVFGFVYLDHKDNEVDEDLYVLNTRKKLLQYYPKGKYEEENPLYKGTHKGLKDFLRPTP
ncbi:hypothetical protein HZA75_02995 [Candidatus Roizmanbacteria bacterium]|nr:hypothetical protein [Candidatus Roizmanbacteria bacterium]